MLVVNERVGDAELLQRYAKRREEGAFGELVARHLGWVYGAARRMTRDAGLAEDVAQGVFLAMSEKAGKLAGHPCLAAWLFEATRMGAAVVMRGERRRKERERVAAADFAARQKEERREAEVMERVDGAVAKLSRADREMVLMHFYEGMSVVEMAAGVGIAEAAARKRLSRALERLKERLGVGREAEGFGVMLAGTVAGAAPAHLWEAIVSGKRSAEVMVVKGAVMKGLSLIWGAVASVGIALGITAAFLLSGKSAGRAAGPVVISTVASQPATQSIVAAVHTLKQRAEFSFVSTPQTIRTIEEYWDRSADA